MKVTKIEYSSITFDNGTTLYSDHYQDCCESHYLEMTDLSLDDFEGLDFDLTNDDFFDRIEGYGITLNPIHGHPVRIPGYGDNNGYYSENLTLILESADGAKRTFDITTCQVIS